MGRPCRTLCDAFSAATPSGRHAQVLRNALDVRRDSAPGTADALGAAGAAATGHLPSLDDAVSARGAARDDGRRREPRARAGPQPARRARCSPCVKPTRACGWALAAAARRRRARECRGGAGHRAARRERRGGGRARRAGVRGEPERAARLRDALPRAPALGRARRGLRALARAAARGRRRPRRRRGRRRRRQRRHRAAARGARAASAPPPSARAGASAGRRALRARRPRRLRGLRRRAERRRGRRLVPPPRRARWRLEAATREPGGARFGAPRPISAFVRRPCCTSVSVAIGARGDAVATWTSTARPAVWAALRRAGRGFRAAAAAGRATGSTRSRVVVGAGGAAALTYSTQHVPLRATDGLQLHRAPRGGPFGPAEHVNPGSGVTVAAAAVTDAGRVLIAWRDRCAARACTSPRPRRASRWPPRRARPDVTAERLAVAADDDGRAVVAWSQRRRRRPREQAFAAMRPAQRRAVRRPGRPRGGRGARPSPGSRGSCRAAARSWRGTRRATAARRSAARRCWSRACPNAILAPPSDPEGRTPWQWTASSEPDPGRTSAIRAPSRTTATRSPAGSPRPATCGSPATPGGQAHQARDLQGPRARRPQQPVARLPPRRPHHGLLLAALRAPPAAARDPQRDALHGLPEPVLDQRLREGPHRRHQRARRARLHLSQPDAAQGQAVALLARRRVEPDLLLHRGRHPLGARARARLLRPRPAAVHEVRHRRQPPDPRHLHRRPPGELEEQPPLRALRERGALRHGRAQARDVQGHPAAHLQARPHLQLLRRAAVAPGATTSRSPPTAGRGSSTRAGSTTATPSSTPTTTARSGSAARSSRPGPGARRSTRAARRSTTRTRASSTCRARSAAGTRSSSGSRPTRGARGRTAS